MSDDPDDPVKEVVGKGRPPRAHRFNPGTSGNPKGRPNGYRNFKKLFENVLNKEVEIKWNGSVATVPLAGVVCMKADEVMSGISDHRLIDSF
jgi:hypothetical protein